MDTDVVLVLIATVIAHCTVAYTAMWLFARKYERQFNQALQPERMIAMITSWLNYRKPQTPGQEGENPTMLEAFCSYLGASLGRYLAGMLGRASRDVNNAALDAAAAANPTIAAILNQPGAKKLLKNPIVASIVQPLIEAAVKGAMGNIQQGVQK